MVGENIVLNCWESAEKEAEEKKAVMKAYSKEALSIKAVEKAWKGASRYAGDFGVLSNVGGES